MILLVLHKTWKMSLDLHESDIPVLLVDFYKPLALDGILWMAAFCLVRLNEAGWGFGLEWKPSARHVCNCCALVYSLAVINNAGRESWLGSWLEVKFYWCLRAWSHFGMWMQAARGSGRRAHSDSERFFLDFCLNSEVDLLEATKVNMLAQKETLP